MNVKRYCIPTVLRLVEEVAGARELSEAQRRQAVITGCARAVAPCPGGGCLGCLMDDIGLHTQWQPDKLVQLMSDAYDCALE